MSTATEPCRFTWGDWRCSKPAHEDDGHLLTWANAEDDVDPRLT